MEGSSQSESLPEHQELTFLEFLVRILISIKFLAGQMNQVAHAQLINSVAIAANAVVQQWQDLFLRCLDEI